MAQTIHTNIPFQVLSDVDNSRNPMQLTKERLERAATENQFMHGIVTEVNVSAFPVPPSCGRPVMNKY